MLPFYALLLSFAAHPAHAANPHLVQKAEGIALQNFAPWVVEHSVSPEPSVSLSQEVVMSRMIDLIEDEDLEGEICYQYLISLCELEEVKLGSSALRLRDLIPTLKLTFDEKKDLLALLDDVNPKTHASVTAVNPPPAFSLEAAFQDVRAQFIRAPSLFSIRADLLAALDLTHDMIVPKHSGGCYENDPGCVYGQNEGLVEYFSKKIDRDPSLGLDLLRFSLRTRKRDAFQPHSGDFSIFDFQKENAWPLALGAAHEQPERAMDLLVIFGHDVCCNSLVSQNPESSSLFAMLNEMRPNRGTSNERPKSTLYAEGALGGVTIPRRIVKKFEILSRRFEAQNGRKPYFRLGYHHVYGGMATAHEYLRHGLGTRAGFKLSTLLSQGLGYFYKRVTLTEFLHPDSLELWKNAKEDETKVASLTAPAGWTSEKFEKAKLELETNLAFIELSEVEHRLGADFALKIYRRR